MGTKAVNGDGASSREPGDSSLNPRRLGKVTRSAGDFDAVAFRPAVGAVREGSDGLRAVRARLAGADRAEPAPLPGSEATFAPAGRFLPFGDAADRLSNRAGVLRGIVYA